MNACIICIYTYLSISTYIHIYLFDSIAIGRRLKERRKISHHKNNIHMKVSGIEHCIYNKAFRGNISCEASKFSLRTVYYVFNLKMFSQTFLCMY